MPIRPRIRPRLNRRWATVAASAVLVAAVGTGLFADAVGRVAGVTADYAAADGDPRLTGEARTALPVLLALGQFHDRTGGYPAGVAQLRPLLPAVPLDVGEQVIGGWSYSAATRPAGFVLRRKLGWDPSLVYRGGAVTDGRWAFDPGDGTPERPVVLRP